MAADFIALPKWRPDRRPARSSKNRSSQERVRTVQSCPVVGADSGVHWKNCGPTSAAVISRWLRADWIQWCSTLRREPFERAGSIAENLGFTVAEPQANSEEWWTLCENHTRSGSLYERARAK